MPGDVIVTVTLNAALHVSYTVGDTAGDGINAVPPARVPGRRARLTSPRTSGCSKR